MFDERVWVVRFRPDTADQLREVAKQRGLTVQQLIVTWVEAGLGAETPSPTSARRADQDLYQYGGGPAIPSRG